MDVQKFLSRSMTDFQIGILKQATQNNVTVYLYGQECTGKSFISEIFKAGGYGCVKEPMDVSPSGVLGSLAVGVKEGAVALCLTRRNVNTEQQGTPSKTDIENWLAS